MDVRDASQHFSPKKIPNKVGRKTLNPTGSFIWFGMMHWDDTSQPPDFQPIVGRCQMSMKVVHNHKGGGTRWHYSPHTGLDRPACQDALDGATVLVQGKTGRPAGQKSLGALLPTWSGRCCISSRWHWGLEGHFWIKWSIMWRPLIINYAIQ